MFGLGHQHQAELARLAALAGRRLASEDFFSYKRHADLRVSSKFTLVHAIPFYISKAFLHSNICTLFDTQLIIFSGFFTFEKAL
jgi:hypothetical protein